MLQVKGRLKSPTKAQVVDELDGLGWEYQTSSFSTGTIYRMMPTGSRKKWFQFWRPNKNALPTVFIGEFSISVVLDPTYNLTITLPYRQIELYRPNPYQLVINFLDDENDDIAAVFGKNGWVNPYEFEKSL